MSTRWRQLLLGLVVLALAAGLAAAFTDGTARRAATTVVIGAALGVALVASSRAVPPPPAHAMGGSGYVVPLRRRVQLLHVLLTLLHNLGIMVVVLAALVRFGLAPVEFNPGIIRWFPTAIAVYLGLLALAAKWRIDEQGGIRQTWYTRTHGVFLTILGGLVVASAIIVMVTGGLTVGSQQVLVDADIEVLALVAILGVGTQLFLAANLPTIFDIGSRVLRMMGSKEERKKATAGTPPVVYAGVLALSGAAVLAFLLFRFDVVGLLGDFQDARVALLVLVFPLFMVLFFGISALQIYRESKRGLYRRKIATKVRTALAVYITSAILGTVFSILMLMSLTGELDSLGPIPGGNNLSKDLIAATILVTAGPIGWYKHRENRRVDAIEARLPDFLNDLAETRRAGLTLTAALQSAALSDYGPLSKEVRKMADQVGWGVAFTEALAQFATRVPTSLVRRSTYLIIESSRTGGSVSEILKAAARDAYEIKGLEAERRTSMMTYLIVIYVVFAVFLAVIAVLDKQFIPQVLAANKAVVATGGEAGSFGGGSTIDEGTLRFTYYLAGIVQAVGNGIVGGVLSEGRVTAGLRHVAIMTGLSWFLFRLALG